MEKALAVANDLVVRARQAGNPVTPLKLQKLLFFAHGWHLALSDKPLLDRPIEAWQHGPVIPSVYGAFRCFGGEPILKFGAEVEFMPDYDTYREITPWLSAGADYALGLLRRIWEVYGPYSPGQLSSLVREPGSPYSQVRLRNPYRRFVPIPDDEIKAYFKRQRELNATACASPANSVA